jgi:hypothetical protein
LKRGNIVGEVWKNEVTIVGIFEEGFKVQKLKFSRLKVEVLKMKFKAFKL